MAGLRRYQQAYQQKSDEQVGEGFYIKGNHNYSDVISSLEYNIDGLYLISIYMYGHVDRQAFIRVDSLMELFFGYE